MMKLKQLDLSIIYKVENLFHPLFFQLQVTSQELQRIVAEKINQFHDKLRSSESNLSGQVVRKHKTDLLFKYNFSFHRSRLNFIRRKNRVGCLNPKKFHGKYGQLKSNKCNCRVKMVFNLLYVQRVEK